MATIALAAGLCGGILLLAAAINLVVLWLAVRHAADIQEEYEHDRLYNRF